MPGQQVADLSDRLHDGVAEFLVLKMSAHLIHHLVPERFAAFFVNRLVAHHCKLMRAGRHENEHRIAFPYSVHSEPLKFFLCNGQRIGVQSAPLNINANLAGSFRVSFANRPNDPLMLKLAEKLLRSHFVTSWNLRRPRRNCRHRR